MKITILGSGGGSGIPNPFCLCSNCEAARRTGGRSLRNSPSVLINEDFLIDCGPDVDNSARQFGIRLSGLRTLVITHRHSDHLDPWFFWGRRGTANTDLPLLTVYAPQDVLDELTGFFRRTFGWDSEQVQALTRTVLRPIRAGMMKLAGRYRVNFYQASHGDETLQAVLVGVQDARAAYLHCYDTGPLSDAVWQALSQRQFDVIALDSCIGLQKGYENSQHMTAAQTIEHAARFREIGIVKPDGKVLATHFVHQAAGAHEDLVAYYEPHGLTVAYDGLILEVGG